MSYSYLHNDFCTNVNSIKLFKYKLLKYSNVKKMRNAIESV